MSFLNPVNAPVLRFKSTDADAPQIDFNSRIAGDVKTLFKACLVTGYGSKNGAGWHISDEADTGAAFTSPFVGLSDYKFVIDDAASYVGYSYMQKNGTTIVPRYDRVYKNIGYADRSHPANSWEMIVSQRGFLFIEYQKNNYIDMTMARITYMGQVKSALIDDDGNNLIFYSIGAGAPSVSFPSFFQYPDRLFCHIGDGISSIFPASALSSMMRSMNYTRTMSSIELFDGLYLQSRGTFIATVPAIVLQTCNDYNKLYNIKDAELDNRPVLTLCISPSTNSSTALQTSSVIVHVYLDYWEY